MFDNMRLMDAKRSSLNASFARILCENNGVVVVRAEDPTEKNGAIHRTLRVCSSVFFLSADLIYWHKILVEDRQVLLRLNRGDKDVEQTKLPWIRRIGGRIHRDGSGTFTSGEIDDASAAQCPYHHGRRLHA